MKLWQHQIEARDTALSEGAFAFFMEQGTGKTLTALSWLKELKERSKVATALVLCPKIVVSNWAHEAEKLDIITSQIRGSLKKRLEALAEDAELYICNFEAMRSTQLLNALHNRYFDAVIVDESHRCKEPSTATCKNTILLADKVDYKLALTGTPILNSELDLWAQFRIIDVPEVDRNFHAFKRKHFEDKNRYMPRHIYFPNWQIKESAKKDMQKLIDTYSYKCTKDECLDLPDLVKKTYYVEMPAKIRRAYDTLEKEFMTLVDDKLIVTDLVITKALRMQQLLNGLAVGEDKTEVECNKPEVLKELLQDIVKNQGHQVIVWANFVHCLDKIVEVCKDLDISYSQIRGGQSADERDDEIRSFQDLMYSRVMIANQQAGGIGINLTAASYMIYYSKGFSLEQDLQSEARCHRGGSERHGKITRIDLVTEDSIEELINEALVNKQSISDALMRWKK